MVVLASFRHLSCACPDRKTGDHFFRDFRAMPGSIVNAGPRDLEMPSLFRFLIAVAVIGGVIYGGIFALANFVNPKPREITVTIPADRFLKK
jgi:hypothetical protein